MPTEQEWIVESSRKERLDKCLVSQFPEHSRARIQSLIAAGHVTVDGRPAKGSERPVAGQRIHMTVPDAVDVGITGENIPLDILHEDDDLLVLVKAAGMVVHPGAGRDQGTLVNALMGREMTLSEIGGELRPGIVHRLDIGTSGVMVVAKNDKAHRHLSQQFEVHSIERQYIAVVHKVPLHDRGTCRSELGRDPNDRLRFASVEEGGKEAITHWECLDRGDRVSLVRCRLETGRTHQIRVHMYEEGWPIVGDRTYTRRDCTPTAALRERVDALTHPLLHAQVLGLIHPRTETFMRWTAPPPADFQDFCRAARLRLP